MKVQLKYSNPELFPATIQEARIKDGRYTVIFEPFGQKVQYSKDEFNFLFNIVEE